MARRPHKRAPAPRRRRRIGGSPFAIGVFALLAIGAAAWPEISPQLFGPSAPTISGRARVVDGDTLDAGGQRIRLHGIDAPERDQLCQDASGRNWRCGASAATELQTLIGLHSVECFKQDTDRYGRVIACCSMGEVDIAEQLVRQGLAVAYTRYSWRYVLPQVRAWIDGVGIWGGDFESPEDWRRRNR